MCLVRYNVSAGLLYTYELRCFWYITSFQLIDSTPMIWDLFGKLQSLSWSLLHLWCEMCLVRCIVSVDWFNTYDLRSFWHATTFQLIYSTPMIWDLSGTLQHISWSLYLVPHIVSVDLFRTYTYDLRSFWFVTTFQLISSTPMTWDVSDMLHRFSWLIKLVIWDLSGALQHFSWSIQLITISGTLHRFSWSIPHLWSEIFLVRYNISADLFYTYDLICFWYVTSFQLIDSACDLRSFWYVTTFQLIYSTPMIWAVSHTLHHFALWILRVF